MPDLRSDISVTDRDGRALVIRMLSPLESMDVMEVAGQNSDNRRWMMNAEFYCSIRSIDGKPCQWPRTRQTLRAHIELCGGRAWQP